METNRIHENAAKSPCRVVGEDHGSEVMRIRLEIAALLGTVLTKYLGLSRLYNHAE